MNRKPNFDAMSIDEMWQLHEEIGRVLSIRLTTEKRGLEKRLAQLRREKETLQLDPVATLNGERRKYPKVLAKYRNPNEPSETWSGRGKQPRWLSAALKSGQTIEEFVIGIAETNKSDGKGARRSRQSELSADGVSHTD
jgi:DNA-binding protein H-NS